LNLHSASLSGGASVMPAQVFWIGSERGLNRLTLAEPDGPYGSRNALGELRSDRRPPSQKQSAVSLALAPSARSEEINRRATCDPHLTVSAIGGAMPQKQTLDRAQRDRRQGKAPSTQAGEFIREEIDDIRKGKHGARSAKQAIAIGLSKARRAGVDLPPPRKGKTSTSTRRRAARDYAVGHGAPKRGRTSTATRSRASLRAMNREKTDTVNHAALASQARSAARRRTASQRSHAALKAAATKGPASRSTAARKAAHTRSRKSRQPKMER
jgi:Family of unknown function (DUF6496)